MTNALSKRELHQAILAGIGSAQEAYCKWAGEGQLSIRSAPEHFLANQIANSIGSFDKCFITMESNILKTMEQAGIAGRGNGAGRPRKGARPNGRSDIVLWWKTGKPRAVIEVKHPLRRVSKGFLADMERLYNIVKVNKNKKGSLQYGAFAFWTWVPPLKGKSFPSEEAHMKALSDSLNNQIKKLYDAANAKLKSGVKLFKKVDLHYVLDENFAWAGVVFIIKAPKGGTEKTKR